MAYEDRPLAVIITGNPKYIHKNEKASRFYAEIEAYLAGLGYRVRRHAGEPNTLPPAATLWIGHSRGADRLQFAPSGTKTLAFGSDRPNAINHPDDTGNEPSDSHYEFTDAMRNAMSST